MKEEIKKIGLSLDDSLIQKDDRETLKDIFNKSQLKTEVFEGDTHTLGGIAWFPTDLIIYVYGLAGLTAAGFFAALGENLYKRLKDVLITILKREKTYNEKIRQFYFAFDHPKLRLYFEIFEFFSDTLGHHVDKIRDDYPFILKEALKIRQMRLKSIGDFASVTCHFDEDEDTWIIAHFNKYI